MEIALLANPTLPGQPAGYRIDTHVEFERWRDHWYDTSSQPDLVYVGTVLDDLLTQSDADEAMLQLFDMGIFPRVFVLTSLNPLALLRQTQLLRLTGYCQPAPRMWTYLSNT